MSTVKEEVIRLIKALPDDCTLEDIQYQLYLRNQVESGLADVEAGRTVPHQEAKRRIAEWRKSSGPNQP
jgi:predicted transcriptional regulator